MSTKAIEALKEAIREALSAAESCGHPLGGAAAAHRSSVAEAEVWQALAELEAQGGQAGEPVAWTLQETLDKRETTCSARLWFSDPVNSSWTALYLHPPAPRELTDAPTDAQIVAAARALNKLQAESCGVDEADSWKLYGNSHIIDAGVILRAAIAASQGAKE